MSFSLRGPTPMRLITVLQVEKGETAPDFRLLLRSGNGHNRS